MILLNSDYNDEEYDEEDYDDFEGMGKVWLFMKRTQPDQ